MKTEEDEAFDDIARKQGAWGGGFPAKRKMAADKLWDKPSVAFDEWWNGDNDESTNPYRLESGAYWAWAGWKAALAQPAQEPVATVTSETGNPDVTMSWWHEPALPVGTKLYTTPPQRPWVWLTEEDFSAINQSCLTKLQAATSAESILKERNS